MKDFLGFLRSHRYLLLFGVMLTYFSSFGQTFLISLYIPEIEKLLQLTNTGISSLYAIATTASAFTLPWIGQLFDTLPLRKFTLMVIIGLIGACLLLSFSFHPVLVLFAFWGLRLFGQGLMSHTSISTMARAFVGNRGKAISIASLGHPLGESTLPIIITLLIVNLGWQSSLQISALSLVIIVIPAIFFLLKNQPDKVLAPLKGDEGEATKRKNPFFVLKERVFWIITPAVFIAGYLNTAIFFFQLKLGASRGWEPTWVAGSISVYALASAIAMMSAGPIVDKFTARRLFPYMLIPYVFGIVILGLVQHPLAYPIGLTLIAISNGAGGVIKNSLFAEIFGVKIIGAVRSVFTTVMVFSTALGPLSFGLLLDASWDFSYIFGLFAIVVLLIIIWSWRLR